MIKRKRMRERGKFSFAKYFQKFKVGDSVAVVMELSQQSSGFPKKMQGRTGKILSKRGAGYVVELNDFNMTKQFSIKPVHLRKIQ